MTTTRHHRTQETGSSSVFTAIVAAALILVLCFGVDATYKARTARVAVLAANEAARAAGQHLTGDAILGRPADVDPAAAATAARTYLATAGISGTVTVSGTTVTVTTSVPWTPHLLPFGGGTLHGTATTDTIRT